MIKIRDRSTPDAAHHPVRSRLGDSQHAVASDWKRLLVFFTILLLRIIACGVFAATPAGTAAAAGSALSFVFDDTADRDAHADRQNSDDYIINEMHTNLRNLN